MGDAREYTIIIYREPGGAYSVTVPAIPGCNTEGADLAEAFDMAKDAIALMLDCMAEHGQAPPDDVSQVSVELDEAVEATVCRLRVPPLEQLPPVAPPAALEGVERLLSPGTVRRIIGAAGIPEEDFIRALEEEEAERESSDDE